jgi:8-oxo-dGTP pyrophosphatase MutT (NUDIX family)
VTAEETWQFPRTVRNAERKVFENPYITVFDDDVLLAGQYPTRYLRIVEREGRPGAAMLARCGDRYALVLNDRYPIDAWEWGIPRGFAHSDDPADTARKELAEEVGGLPRTLTPLGVVTPNSGLLASRVHVFLADFDAELAAPAEPAEIAMVRWISLPDLLDEIATGRITDGFTLSAITLATARRLIG